MGGNSCLQRVRAGEGWLLRVIQLLTTLLLESASRPAPGALSAVAATAAFTALQKVGWFLHLWLVTAVMWCMLDLPGPEPADGTRVINSTSDMQPAVLRRFQPGCLPMLCLYYRRSCMTHILQLQHWALIINRLLLL